LSDDGWLGNPQDPDAEPGAAPYRQGKGRRGRQPQPGGSGQYPQQHAQQYPQDAQYQQGAYAQRPYPSGYPENPAQDYYDETSRRAAAQDWNNAPQGYPGQQGYHPHRVQPDAPRLPDPYASGSYGADGYPQDPYSRPDPYASDPYQQSSAGYDRPTRDPQSTRDTNAGGYPTSGRDGYASGAYPTTPRDPYQSSGSYPTTGTGYSTGSYSTGVYPAVAPQGSPNPAGRTPTGPQGPRPGAGQGADPYGRRAGTAGSGGYPEYEDDDFPVRSSRRPSTYGGTDTFSAGVPAAGRGQPPSRRRAAVDGDYETGDDRLSLIDDEDGEGGSGRGRKAKQKRGRNCLAVFIAFSVIAGGLGYGGYKGVQWYQSKYGPAPDYVSTTGTGVKVDVAIPSGVGGKTIGSILFTAGVVKSQRAFTDACSSNSNCANVESGTYLLPKGISAASAVAALLDLKNQDNKSQLITYGGERAGQIFASLESKTGWKDADIRSAIAGGNIDLPAWDTGQPGTKFPYAHIEGFVASESYVLSDYKSPVDLLKRMVDDQLVLFDQEDLAGKAKALGVTEYKLLIIASLARAEAGQNTADLNKIAGVVFNRFNSPAFEHLGFDTSTLYGMGNTGTVPNNTDTANPYNTSIKGIKGLPPSPIDNPDQNSIDAAAKPNRDNGYVYFCAAPDGVHYASNNTQWTALGQKYPGLCGSH
jgi:UPF0755 protein